MLQYFKCKQNLLRSSIWIYTITTLWVNQLEILAKELDLDVDYGYKGAAHIWKDLLRIYLFKDFSR